MTAKVYSLEIIERQRELASLLERSEQTEAKRKAPNTREAYARWAVRFDEFCQLYRVKPGSDALRAYLSLLDKDGYTVSSIKQAYAGIVDAYPTSRSNSARNLLQGIRQDHKDQGRSAKGKHAFTLELCEQTLACIIDNNLRAMRDRALLSVQWVTASRPSELLGLCVDHILTEGDTISLEVFEKDHDTSRVKSGLVRKDSKLYAFEHLTAYLNQAGLKSGPVWRKISTGDNPTSRALTESGYATIFRRLLAQARMDRKYTPHCVRTGYITSQAMAGASLAEIIAVTGHQNIESVKHYFDRAIMLRDNPMDRLQ